MSYANNLAQRKSWTDLGRPRTSDFSHCNYRAAQMKHTVVYGSAHTGDYLIVVIKKSQRVPFTGLLIVA
jgi:hypothetical protein